MSETEEKVMNLLHCAKYIRERISFLLTEDEIIEILDMETEYMLENGYADAED